MTNQEVFNTVAAHLLAQGKRCTVDSLNVKGCSYRNGKGLKCAIGCLIPTHKYSFDFEGRGVGNTAVREAAGLRDDQLDFAAELQRAHDCLPVEQWASVLRAIALTYGLTYQF